MQDHVHYVTIMLINFARLFFVLRVNRQKLEPSKINFPLHNITLTLFLLIITSYFTPSWRDSDTPIILIASSMLLQIFAACPAPLSPQCITALPIHSRRGVARSHDSLDPPTMNVSIPLVAAPTPIILIIWIIITLDQKDGPTSQLCGRRIRGAFYKLLYSQST